ncbi:BnaA09g23100D [Brassica napus]|uniref:(rape) hypothetical protein n=1 Tax=Brassica napus TaxID=3708 RepID=A0A078IFY8_BRANA|nr:unnamed protein product [Brassica napus]CDY48048.1 BnaA09g23100D [Brassica napus]
MKEKENGVANDRLRQSLRIRKPDSIVKKPTAVIIHQTTRIWGVISLWIITSMIQRRSRSVMWSRRCCLCRRVINSVLIQTIGEQIMLVRIIDEEITSITEQEADDNAQKENEKEKENNEADKQEKEDKQTGEVVEE